ncbi:MAG: DUF721 domain-containing protein [Actinomycetota bacterium]|nr:DUF721 domain-containing protein [Actinomycetota bacterium]
MTGAAGAGPRPGSPGGAGGAGGPQRPVRRRADRDGRRRDGPVPLAEALGAVADRLGVGRADVVATVFGRWADLVGPALAGHTRPLRLEGGTLWLAVDHPAWATEVRRMAPRLLAALADACGPSHAPERLEVQVRHPS